MKRAKFSVRRAWVAPTLLALLSSTVFLNGTVNALPFNTDMYHPQPMTGEVMRPKAANSVPLGSLERRIEKKEDAAKLTNPLKGDKLSIASGQRLFAINCSPCHGAYNAAGAQELRPVTSMIGAPDLSGSSYWDPQTDGALYGGRSDGNIYGTIHLGGMAIMPAYGWKLSPTEHWDIINYLRSFQEAKRKTPAK